MACKRDIIINLTNYIESLGVEVNIGKNKARGNKGLFSRRQNCYRIDISKDIDDSCVLPTLLHEFAHFIHYKYDSTLKSLDFIFDNLNETELDELQQITVEKVPKEFAQSLYSLKQELSDKNKEYIKRIKTSFPEFKASQPFGKIEKSIKYPIKYLLRYDNVQFLKWVYSVDTLAEKCPNLTQAQIFYIKLKSNQRKITKINSKINRLNKYYNQPTELWARFFELFFMDNQKALKIAPNISQKFITIIEKNKIPEIVQINQSLQNFEKALFFDENIVEYCM